MDRVTRRFGVPDGFVVVGLFCGALALSGLAVLALIAAESAVSLPLLAVVGAFAVVVGSSIVLAQRLRGATARVEEAGSRLKVLVEHVPAAVYIDVADPGVSDGGRLDYMSP